MSAFTSFHEPGFWLVMALLTGIAILAARPFLPQGWRMPLMAGYWTLFPYLAYISGGVSLRLMGVIYQDWLTVFRLGVGLVLALMAILGIAQVAVMRDSRTRPSHATREAATPERWATALAAVGLSGAEELYWCFLRGVIYELMLSLNRPAELPFYWSIWAAALLASPVAVTVQSTGIQRVVKVIILIMTSILFFYSRSFWLCWLLHAFAWVVLVTIPKQTPAYASQEKTHAKQL